LDAGEIAADAVLEIFGFPYIDDGIRFIEIAIHPGLFGECGQDAFRVEVGHVSKLGNYMECAFAFFGQL
jgi:hypothetical protein